MCCYRPLTACFFATKEKRGKENDVLLGHSYGSFWHSSVDGKWSIVGNLSVFVPHSKLPVQPS